MTVTPPSGRRLSAEDTPAWLEDVKDAFATAMTAELNEEVTIDGATAEDAGNGAFNVEIDFFVRKPAGDSASAAALLTKLTSISTDAASFADSFTEELQKKDSGYTVTSVEVSAPVDGESADSAQADAGGGSK